MDSIGKKTGFVCLVAVAGSVVLFRQKKILGRILGKMFQVKKTIRDKCIRWEEEEEELPHVELWLLVNRLYDHRYGKPIEQAVVVINNETLQKLNKRKWVSSSLNLLPDIIEIEPPFFQVKPSLQALSSLAVCDGSSSIYLLGGKYYRTKDSSCSGGKVNAFCINVTNVVSRGTKEEEEAQHSRPLSLMLESNCEVCAAAVTNQKEIYAFGRSEFAFGDVDYDSSTFGEIYDIRDNRWMPFKKVPFEDAARYTILGCVTWDSMIALFLQKEVEEEDLGDGRKYKHETKVSYYDLKEEKWISTVVIDEDDDVEISRMCFPVLVVEDKIVFLVQSSSLYRYDLVNKCITGKIQGLKQIEELTHGGKPRDVVYLGSSNSSSDGKKYLKFCIFWVEYINLNKVMRFAVIKVGDDVGDKLTVRMLSSVASIEVGRDYGFIKAAAHLN